MNPHVSSGVWGRSAHAAYERYIIFCVGQDPYRIAAFKSWATDRFGFKPLIGCYKGQMEQSFIANEKHLAQIEQWTVAEESTLHLAAGCPPLATLRYRDGREEQLGHFVSVGRDLALAQQSWTYDPLTAEYFICI